MTALRLTITVTGVILAVMSVILILGYAEKWEWVGVTKSTIDVTTLHRGDSTETTDIAQNVQRGKTFWDLLSLFIAPLLLALGGALIGSIINRAQNWRSDQRAQDQGLQEYFDRIDKLMTELRAANNSTQKGSIRSLIGAQTLATLLSLDKTRKRQPLKLLANLDLLNTKHAQNCRVDLSDADLDHADLREAVLPYTDLHRVFLRNADLAEANLQGADLTKANLQGADLTDTKFQYADLTDANLRDAKGADLNGDNFEGATLKNTVLPDGQIHQ